MIGRQPIDASVQTEAFPFTGYTHVLSTIFELAAQSPGLAVLDVGSGAGALAEPFVRAGCRVWGVDFSEEMLNRARRKLPCAVFAHADMRDRLPAGFPDRYDAIVSGYTFHHFLLTEKAAIARRLLEDHLFSGAPLLIGDIAFTSAAAEDELRRMMGNDWSQEYYWLADETLPVFAAAGMQARFYRVSNCAGVFEFRLGTRA